MATSDKRNIAFIIDNLLILLLLILIRDIYVDFRGIKGVIDMDFWKTMMYIFIPRIMVLSYMVGTVKYWDGKTIGKKIMKIKVVNESDLEEIGNKKNVKRELWLKQVPNLLTMGGWFLINMVFAALRKDGRAIHDLIAKTKVISEIEYEENKQKKQKSEIKTKANIKKNKK